MPYCVFGSDGIDLNFQTVVEYEDFKLDEMMLKLRHYKALREKYGVWATNQNKYVPDKSHLNLADSRYMEELLDVYESCVAQGCTAPLQDWLDAKSTEIRI